MPITRNRIMTALEYRESDGHLAFVGSAEFYALGTNVFVAPLATPIRSGVRKGAVYCSLSDWQAGERLVHWVGQNYRKYDQTELEQKVDDTHRRSRGVRQPERIRQARAC